MLQEQDRVAERLAPDLCRAELERIAGSALFHGSEALTKLLRYLAQHSLSAPAFHLKEYQIATEVLGRSADFDPQTDSCVRVQVGRLRSKLAEYYESVGAHDPILIKVPKGGYVLSFEPKLVAAEPEPPAKIEAPSTAPAPARQWNLARVGLAVALTFLFTAGGMLYYFRGNPAWPLTAQAAAVPSTPAVASLWGPFLHDAVGPYVVYSNAAFVGSPYTGMHYYNPARDPDHDVEQHYTGVGELAGSVKLAQMFDHFGRQFRLKRAGLFTLDDALNNDLVFLGSPTENSPLDKVTTTHEFTFEEIPGEKAKPWGFVPVHPRPGDPAGYFGTPSAAPYSLDYAVVALEKGLNPSRSIVILEGISTLSTQAAVEFSCNEASIESVMKKLGVKPGSPVPPFEALIRVKVADDVPLETELVDARRTVN